MKFVSRKSFLAMSNIVNKVTMGLEPMIVVLQTTALTNLATSPYLSNMSFVVAISKTRSFSLFFIELPVIIAILSVKANSPNV